MGGSGSTRMTPEAARLAAAEAGRPETTRVRMTVDLDGPLSSDLQAAADRLGRCKADVLRMGLGFVFRALQARDHGPIAGGME